MNLEEGRQQRTAKYARDIARLRLTFMAGQTHPQRPAGRTQQAKSHLHRGATSTYVCTPTNECAFSKGHRPKPQHAKSYWFQQKKQTMNKRLAWTN
eukprot:1160224-Pelagomonas_calceolata.AAC.15